MNQDYETAPPLDYASLSFASFLEDLWDSLRRAVGNANQRKLSRARLAGLSPHLLKDIGVDQRQAFEASFNRFWED